MKCSLGFSRPSEFKEVVVVEKRLITLSSNIEVLSSTFVLYLRFH